MTALPALSPNTGGRCIEVSATQSADIIVSTTKHPISWAIRVGTASAISHAALYTGEQVIEANEKGVIEQSLKSSLAQATLAVVYRHPRMTQATAAGIVRFARAKRTIGYDLRGALSANSGLCVIIFNPAGCAVSRLTNSSNTFYCSELVLEAYRSVGLPLTNGLAANQDPQAIVSAYSRGTLQYLGHLKS